MIITELYNGQGLGNQLWCYCVTRVIALDQGYKFGIMHPEKFKGADFMSLDFGEKVEGGEGPEGGPPKVLPANIRYYYKEMSYLHPEHKCDVTPYDPGLIHVPDKTKLDGAMQAEQYILHRRNEIRRWLAPTKQVTDYSAENICVIHVRGGDFAGQKEVFLPPSYYRNAMNMMLTIKPDMKFVCVSDHPEAATQVLEGRVPIVGAAAAGQHDPFRASHHLGGPVWIDYTIMYTAKYLIIPNSSFSWWAAWTNSSVRLVIAPKYWARFNISDGFWSQGDALTSGWQYLDREGRLSTYEQCREEKTRYDNTAY